MREYMRVASRIARKRMMLPRVEFRKSLSLAVIKNLYAMGVVIVQFVDWVRVCMISLPLVASPFKIS